VLTSGISSIKESKDYHCADRPNAVFFHNDIAEVSKYTQAGLIQEERKEEPAQILQYFSDPFFAADFTSQAFMSKAGNKCDKSYNKKQKKCEKGEFGCLSNPSAKSRLMKI
jgi:hypothetical protein